MDKKVKIVITPGGPYEIQGGATVMQATIESCGDGSERWIRGKKYDTSPTTYLCRCGRSKNKPFCDAMHEVIGFKGEETADKAPYDQQVKIYTGEAFDLMDQENLCATARFCHQDIGVWRMTFKSGNPKYAEMARTGAGMCPSGRLTAIDKDGTKHEPQLDKEIGVVEDPEAECLGPLWVKGGIEIEGADGTPYEPRNRVTLCRCGESSNLPFCDAAHMKCDHMKIKRK